MPDASWQEAILREFLPGVSLVTVVADPDGLLEHEGIHAVLRERGFSLLRFEDPVAFRYIYESRFRGAEAQAGLVVLVPAPPAALESLPYDILASARRLAFSLGELFPNLHHAVVAALDGADRDALHDAAARLDRLLAIATEALPKQDAQHQAWFRFADVWAKVALHMHSPKGQPSEQQQQRVERLRTRLDAAFARWVAERYAGLASLPPNPPVMLHHIPRFLAQALADQATADKSAKVALVVVDGLALDQWAVLRAELARQRPGWRFRDGAAFAWAPTVTSVSRQAAFAGKPPFLFPDSIRTTNREETLWRRFWEDEGVAGAIYAKGLGDGPFEKVEALVQQPSVRVAGLVVDKVDRIMHGMTLGAAGMHNQVRQWAEEGHFAALLDLLFAHGFHVYITSDHGNVEAEGCGRPDEGVVADVRGERVRVYSKESLRHGVAARFPDAWRWPADGLPADYLPLLAPGRKAFVREGERVVAHGGVCLEELIVPFAQVEPPA